MRRQDDGTRGRSARRRAAACAWLLPPLRVVILAPHPQVRSPLLVLTPLLAEALRRRGCAVRVEPWGRRREAEPAAARVISRGVDFARILRTLRAAPCDVLLVQTAHDWKTLSRDIPLLWATRRLCRRRVVQLHGCWSDRLVGNGSRAFKLASHLLARLCDALLVLSREEQRQWQAFRPGARVYVTRNPFVPATPPVVRPRSAFGLPDHVPIVLFAGRLVEWKGPYELLTAVSAVFARTPGHLLIAGDGPERWALQQRVATLGLTPSVTFAGHLGSDELHSAYAAAQVFVLPSRSGEGFPYAILEAMAAGLPIVTTAIRGMADHLRDGVNGLLVAPRDAGALAAALERLLADTALRGRMGQANRAQLSEFAPDVVAAEQLAILQEIVGGAPPGEHRTDSAASTTP